MGQVSPAFTLPSWEEEAALTYEEEEELVMPVEKTSKDIRDSARAMRESLAAKNLGPAGLAIAASFVPATESAWSAMSAIRDMNLQIETLRKNADVLAALTKAAERRAMSAEAREAKAAEDADFRVGELEVALGVVRQAVVKLEFEREEIAESTAAREAEAQATIAQLNAKMLTLRDVLMSLE